MSNITPVPLGRPGSNPNRVLTPPCPLTLPSEPWQVSESRPSPSRGPGGAPPVTALRRTRTPRDGPRSQVSFSHGRAKSADEMHPSGDSMSILVRLRRIIARVPRGRVVTYGEVARLAGFSRAARLTVWALQGAEGLPWHRVVAAGGRIALSGPEGDEQRERLRSEGVTFREGRVRMDRHAWPPAVSVRPTRSEKGPPPVARVAKPPRSRTRRTLGRLP